MVHHIAPGLTGRRFFRTAGAAHDNRSASGDRRRNKARAILVDARHGNKNIAGFHLA